MKIRWRASDVFQGKDPDEDHTLEENTLDVVQALALGPLIPLVGWLQDDE